MGVYYFIFLFEFHGHFDEFHGHFDEFHGHFDEFHGHFDEFHGHFIKEQNRIKFYSCILL